MAVLFSNNATTTVSAGVTTSATSITVADGSVFPSLAGSDYFYVTLEADNDIDLKEIVKCTARSGNTLTVVRGEDGTSARTFSSGDRCELRLCAAALNDAVVGANTTEISVYQFTGDGSTTAFTLSSSPIESLTNVFLSGVYQNKTTYSVSGTTLTFSTAPPSGVVIEVTVAEVVEIAVGTVANSAVTTPKIANDAVTTQKIANDSVTADKVNSDVFADPEFTGTATTPELVLNGSIFKLDSANGLLGVGTDSPAGITPNVKVIAISDSGAKTTGDKLGALAFVGDDSSFAGTFSDGVAAEISAVCISATGAAYALAFATATTTGSNRVERVRITTDGMMVGKTLSDGTASRGIELLENGSIVVSRHNGEPMRVDRNGSDGSLVAYSKDGTVVGSVKCTNSGGNLQIDTPQSGVEFGDDGYLPVRNGAITDDSVSVGSALSRYKDLYLSGGIFLGGTTVANKLDDVETGTWTPTLEGETTAGSTTYSNRVGYYTKIGDIVHCHCMITNTNHTGAGNLLIKGLPFSSNNEATGTFQANQHDFSFSFIYAGFSSIVQHGDSHIHIRGTYYDTTAGPFKVPVQNFQHLRITISYRTT